jgi:hypothetical protein
MLSHPVTPTSFPTPGTNARTLNPSPVRVVNPQDLSQSNLPAVEFLATIGRELKVKIGSELGCRDTTESYYYGRFDVSIVVSIMNFLLDLCFGRERGDSGSAGRGPDSDFLPCVLVRVIGADAEKELIVIVE